MTRNPLASGIAVLKGRKRFTTDGICAKLGYPPNNSSPPNPDRATFKPDSLAARLTQYELTPSTVGWSIDQNMWSRELSKSVRVTHTVWCVVPYVRATASAIGVSSFGVPLYSSKPNVTVFRLPPSSAASAASVVESNPEERNTPTGTSAIK